MPDSKEITFNATPDDPRVDPASPQFDIETYFNQFDPERMSEARKRVDEHFSNIAEAMRQSTFPASAIDEISEMLQKITLDLAARAIAEAPDRALDIVAEFAERLSVIVDEQDPDALQISMFPEAGNAQEPDNKKIVETLTKAFGVIRQGSATNALSKIRSDRAKVDAITGTATVKSGNLTVTLQDFNSIAGFKPSTHKLLDALTRKFTETGAKSPFVSLPLDEYMEMRGLSDKKEARKQVNADLLTMYKAELTFKERKGGSEKDWLRMRICDAVGMIKRGNIFFSFGSTYYSYLMRCTIMPYPLDAFRLDDRKNPNSYFLSRKIAEHKNMNAGKLNENIISVKTLLAACPYLPKYDEVKNADRAINRRIIEPFERDMNALSSFLSWEYCGVNGTPLPDEKVSMPDYDAFINARILVHWTREYPDQTKRLERKEARKRGVADSKKGGSGQQKGG